MFSDERSQLKTVIYVFAFVNQTDKYYLKKNKIMHNFKSYIIVFGFFLNQIFCTAFNVTVLVI